MRGRSFHKGRGQGRRGRGQHSRMQGWGVGHGCQHPCHAVKRARPFNQEGSTDVTPVEEHEPRTRRDLGAVVMFVSKMLAPEGGSARRASSRLTI